MYYSLHYICYLFQRISKCLIALSFATLGVIQKEDKRVCESRANESYLLDADDADNADSYF